MSMYHDICKDPHRHEKLREEMVLRYQTLDNMIKDLKQRVVQLEKENQFLKIQLTIHDDKFQLVADVMDLNKN